MGIWMGRSSRVVVVMMMLMRRRWWPSVIIGLMRTGWDWSMVVR